MYLLTSILFGVAINAQAGKVGINTSTPTEILNVNGTTRISSLPTNGTPNSIYTKPDGTMSAAKDQTFNATKTVVADNNGVLGTIDGISLGIGSSASKTITSITTDTSDGLRVQSGCLMLELDPYNNAANWGYGTLALHAQVSPSCGSGNVWTAASQVGGTNTLNDIADYWRGNLTTTGYTTLSGMEEVIADTPVYFGRISLFGVNPVQVYEYTVTANGSGPYTFTLETHRIQ